MDSLNDDQPEVSRAPVKRASSDMSSPEAQQDKAQGDASFQISSPDEKIFKPTSEVFQITRPEDMNNADFASGIFRVTRPTSVVKNTDLCSKVSTCPMPNDTVSCQSKITGKKHTSNSNERLTGKKCISATRRFKEKRSGYRNKQPMIPCNYNSAILLPRPQISIPQQTLAGAHIQRIPVLNNTFFQLPKNVPIASNSVTDAQIADKRSTKIVQDGLRLISNSNESVQTLNLCYSDQNNNSRVRNTQKDTEPNDTSTGESMFERNANDSMKSNTNSEVKTNGEVKQDRLEQKEVIRSVDVSLLETESCSTVCERSDIPNKLSVSNVLQYTTENFPSTNECFEGISPSNATKDVQPSRSFTDIHLTGVKSAEVELNANTTESSIYVNPEDIMVHKSKEDITEHTVNAQSRKRTYTDTSERYIVELKTGNMEMVKKSYVITNKCAYKKTADKQEETESKPFPKNSKVFQDIESRYMRHDLAGSTSFEKVFDDKCDIINKVESEKLSEVKDHHLLKLSDKERKYLRSKCYLENNLVNDVRRRFEQSPDNKNEFLKSTNEIVNNIHGIQPNEELMTKATNVNSNDHEPTLNNDMKVKTDSSNTKEKHDLLCMENKDKLVKDHKFIDQSHWNISLKQPVVRLQRLDYLPLEKSRSSIVETPGNQGEVSATKVVKNNGSTSKKVFYVVNSNELAKLNKHTDCARSASINDNTKPVQVQPSIMQTKTETAVSVNMPVNTVFSQSVLKSPPVSSGTNKKATTISYSNVDISDRQLEFASSVVDNKSSNHIKQLKTGPLIQQTAYSNKITVKELLEAKRDEGKNNSVTSRHSYEKVKRSASFPVQLYGRAIYGNPLITEHATGVPDVKNINLNIAKKIVAINTDTGNSSSLPESSVQENVYQNVTPVQTSRTIRIVNPHAHKPSSANQQLFIAPMPSMSLPNCKIEKSDQSTSLSVRSSDGEHNLVTCSEKEDSSKLVYIKIGDQTVIVKRREDKSSKKRKTLPAPKPKRTVVDDYKRKRKCSIDRFTKQMHRKSLGSNLKKLLKESDNKVHKLMYTLDLVPVELIKQISDTNVSGKTSDSEPNTPNKKTINSANEIEEKCVDIQAPDRSRSRERKNNVCKSSTNTANVIQINKLEDETVSYSVQEINVQFRKEGASRDHSLSSNIGYPCRLKFSIDGVIEKIYVERLKKGFYLVKNTSGDKTKLASRRKMYTYLVPYPPHIQTVPNDSMSIAIGEIYPEKQKSQNPFRNEDNDIQGLLERFLYPLKEVTNFEFVDERYSSITDKSMSPRSSSPMFYSKEMKHAFDDLIEESMFASDYNLSRRSETNLTKFDLQTTRFSERAMALKIKQNELFESCKKLKSEHMVKVGNKKKRDKALPNVAAKTEAAKDKDNSGVRVLNNPRDVLNEETYYYETVVSKSTINTDDDTVDVDA
ncbi:uncharacterized protein LOC132729504 [Ruditapes philippinarum]|uniref:uncharacterized protein LOC132729504 n=1 Tax=Ruditapes philippinarum TaxID=129788 RepID=UPI00295C237E|nr:uncharacterized protein LOC132729504 [Ruditapes philippinarum]